MEGMPDGARAWNLLSAAGGEVFRWFFGKGFPMLYQSWRRNQGKVENDVAPNDDQFLQS